MKLMYAPQAGTGPTFEIEADRHGSYTIKQEGKVVRRVTAITNYVGRPRWGSRRLAQAALDDAKWEIDSRFDGDSIRP